MAADGEVVFYTAVRPVDPVDVMDRLLVCSQATSFVLASRTIGNDDEWDRFVRNDDELLPPTESVGIGCGIRDLARFYREGTCLRVLVGSCPLAERVERAIEESVPASVRGNFCPNGLGVAMGYHDLFEEMEEPDGMLFARAFLSVYFRGYFLPNDPHGMREQVFRLSEIQRVREELEAITGSLRECIYWSV